MRHFIYVHQAVLILGAHCLGVFSGMPRQFPDLGDFESCGTLRAGSLPGNLERGAQGQSHTPDSTACLHKTQQYAVAHTSLHNIHKSTVAGGGIINRFYFFRVVFGSRR